MCEINANEELINKLEQDYNCALIHLLWCVRNGKRHIIFGMVEMYPSEITDIPELPEQTNGQADKGYRLYYIRHKKIVRESVEWYRDIKDSCRVGMNWNENASFFQCPAMSDLRLWPRFDLNRSDSAPFIADSWGIARTHHIYSSVYNSELENFLLHSKLSEWAEKYLLWDIRSYRELIGSVHFVLPNPLYSKRRIRLNPGLNEAADEAIITFQPRKNKNLQNITVNYFETSIAGASGKSSFPVKNNACKIKLNGEAGEFSITVEDSSGILDYSKKAPFIREIKFDIYSALREKVIHVPDIAGNESHVNKVTTYERASSFDSQAKTQPADWKNKIYDEIFRRKKLSEGNKYDQKIFDNNEDAKVHIKNLIHSAKYRITIIDPYISVPELFEYAFEGTKDKMEITILTSKDEFKKSAQWQQAAKLAASNQINIFGMTGSPVIHDRFLIIDDDIWLIGGSFNAIGKRLSMIIRLPDPKSLEVYINKIINSEQVKLIKDW